MSARNPRDERGWRIPQEGTRSRAIYDLLVQGLRGQAIQAQVGGSQTSLNVLAWRIKHPDEDNARADRLKKRTTL